MKAAIVTGSSRGIGRAIALSLAQDGFAVVVNYAGRKDAGESVVSEIIQGGGEAILVQGDVSKKETIRKLFDGAEKEFGGVDVLVNNAGVIDIKPVGDTSDESFDHIFAINVKGPFMAMREAAARLRSGGRIINFSTSASALVLPGYATYCASKHAIDAYTRIFAKELRGRNITVNAVAPGPVDTELFNEGKTKEQIEAMSKMAPLERLGTPEDIARVVSFLASEESFWINGQIIRANGGIV